MGSLAATMARMNAMSQQPPLSSCRDQMIRRAVTLRTSPAEAAAELHAGLVQAETALVVLFCSPQIAEDTLAEDIAERFAGVPVIGCTTAGEITPFGYRHGSITGVSFAAPDFHAVTRPIADVRGFSVADGRDLVQSCLAELDATERDWPLGQVFAMLLIDGLTTCEESVVSALHRELGPIPLFGGSAGDELTFGATKVLHGGKFHPHSAVLVLVATDHPFRVFKTEHFVSSQEKMVITEADPVRRIVTEINAEPAAQEYARMVGLSIDKLTPMIFANYPVVVRVGNMPYVRSIQKVNEDASLTFFCAIDEGIVLTVAKGLDIAEDLQRLFDELAADIGPPELVIGCDCILRNLEIRQKGLEGRISALMTTNNVVGFNTYGEQFHAMHVNQTFTGVAIGRRN